MLFINSFRKNDKINLENGTDRSYLYIIMGKGEDTRQFIIEKAAALFNQKGIAGTAISDIMEATSLAKGGIYRRFQSKEEITLEAFNYLFNRLSGAIKTVLEGQSAATDKLFALLDLYHDRLAMEKNGGCPLLNFGTEADDTDPVLKEEVAKGIKAIQDMISQTVQDGIHTGEFQAAVDADTFGIKMFNLLEGSILACRVMNNKQQMKMMTDLLKIEINGFLKQ
jgi:TetR/AcrR family transcriptional repressor of nem operon